VGDNIEMDLGEIGLSGVDLICLAQDREKWRAPVNAVMKCWEIIQWLQNSSCLE
jgi:hypothetical protein